MKQQAPVTTALAQYSATEAGIAKLREQFGATVWVITDSASLESAKKARAEIRQCRFDLEAMRKGKKEGLLEAGRAIDAEAKRLEAAILEIEKPCDEAIKAEEKKREAERVAKQQAEQMRVAKLNERIAEIRNRLALAADMTSSEIAEERNDLAKLAHSPGDFQEMQSMAEQVIADTLTRMNKLLVDTTKREQDAARVEEQQAEIRKLKDQLAAREAEQKAAAEAQRKQLDEEQRAHREKMEAEQREHRARIDAEQTELRKAQEAEAARLRAERDAAEAEQRKQDEAKRIADEAVAAKKRAEEAEARKHMDAREALSDWVRRFGGLRKYAAVTKVINQALGEAVEQGSML